MLKLHLLRVSSLVLALLLGLGGVEAQGIAEEIAAEELARADEWLAVAARKQSGENRVARWLMPMLQAGVAVTATAAVFVQPETRPAVRWGVGVGAAGSAALTVPMVLGSDEQRPLWSIGSLSLLVSATATGVLIDSREPRDCSEDCLSRRAERFLGAAMLTNGVAFLGALLLPRPPSLADLEAARLLPPEQRVRATERLLLRRDRAQRSASSLLTFAYLAGGGVAAAGALSSDPGEGREALTGASAVWLSQALVHMLIGLATPRRLERFIAGERPRRAWGNVW